MVTTDELLEDLDNRNIGISTTSESDKLPKISCGGEFHEGDPIREGGRVVALMQHKEGEWEIERTFCQECNILEEYTNLSDENPKAIVEGVVVPTNEDGSEFDTAYISDAFVWELYEKH